MKIRPKAVALITHEHKLLVCKCHDRVKQQDFYFLIGGGIEFGERAEDALKREIMEELGYEVKSISFLEVYQNIFEFESTPGHEIVFLFSVELEDNEAPKQTLS